MIVGMRSRIVSLTSGCMKTVPPMRAGPPLNTSARACKPSVATAVSEARVIAKNRMVSDQAENELPQPQPPVEFGFLKVKPEPCIDVT